MTDMFIFWLMNNHLLGGDLRKKLITILPFLPKQNAGKWEFELNVPTNDILYSQ